MHRKSSLGRLVAITCLIGLALSRDGRAGGGYGSVWTEGVTSSSITLNWTDPTGNYRYVPGTPPTFQICYKVGGDAEGACNGGTVLITQQKPYVLSGLQANTSYKIKVYGWTEHKNLVGNWRNPEFRKVGTITQSTKFQVILPENSIRVSGTSVDGIDVEVTVPNPQDYEFIRVCYKTTFNFTLVNFCTTCKSYYGPLYGWGGSDANLGAVEEPPAGSGFTTTLHLTDLKECRQYKVCAYGFAPGGGDGFLIGEAKARTGTGCRMIALDLVTSIRDVIADPIEDNYEDVLVQYDSAVTMYYDGISILDHISEVHAELAGELAVLEEEGNEFAPGFHMLRFLIQERRDLFDEWQSEPSLVASHMTLDLWLQDNRPDLYAALLDEASVLPPGNPIPTFSEWGAIIFGSLLLGSVAFYLWRRRQVATA